MRLAFGALNESRSCQSPQNCGSLIEDAHVKLSGGLLLGGRMA